MTVRQARSQKQDHPPDLKRHTSCTIAVANAHVVIRFQQGESTQERVKAALEQALALRLYWEC